MSHPLPYSDASFEYLPFTHSDSPSVPPLQMRGHGVGTVMALSFLRIAKDLGYKASYFNLVFGRQLGDIWRE